MVACLDVESQVWDITPTLTNVTNLEAHIDTGCDAWHGSPCNHMKAVRLQM